MNIPVFLIAWRRPQALREVLNAIRPVASSRPFVACDGPNPARPDEAEKVAATREVIEQEIDWPCQIERLYSDVNQGCRLGVTRAITWFFVRVEEEFILEDDCVPHPDFFNYCGDLPSCYRYDSRIMSIGRDIEAQDFQNSHFCDYKNFEKVADLAILLVFIAKPIGLCNCLYFLACKKCNHTGILDGESEITAKSTSGLIHWLDGPDVKLKFNSKI